MKSKGTYIGELEELILLVVGVLGDEAYAVAVLQEIKSQAGREVNISAIHAVLNRLEEKGWLSSSMGGASKVRGGRRKRYYHLTSAGREMLDQVRAMRENLYAQLPSGASLSFSI